MKTTTFSELAFNNIVRKTEKAVCLNCMVSWNANCHSKDIWFPLSVISEWLQNGHVMVADWFLNKVEESNTFHGYEMRFETRF